MVSFGEGASDRVVILSARPRTVLERNGEVLSRVAGVKEGEQLRIRARDGELDVTVDGATSSPTSS